MSFDPTKPVRTRDGRPARIICTDRYSEHYPIVALVDNMPELYTEDGRVLFSVTSPDPDDLINIPKRHVRWFNIYMGKSCDGWGHNTKEEADQQGGAGRCACVRLEFEEGEGL